MSEIKPSGYNPRKISETALAGLSKSIEKHGLVVPPVWNKRTGRIVGGHQRYKILEKQGKKEIKVVVVDISEKDEKVLNIVLNNEKIQGEWDVPKLQLVLDEIKLHLAEGEFDELRLDELSLVSFPGEKKILTDEDFFLSDIDFKDEDPANVKVKMTVTFFEKDKERILQNLNKIAEVYDGFACYAKK